MDLNFAIGYSVPTANKSSIIPISAIRLTVSMLLTRLNGGVYGPIIIPAMINPITMGCLSLKVIPSITAATTIITARSMTTISPSSFWPLTKEGKSDGRGDSGAVWFT